MSFGASLEFETASRLQLEVLKVTGRADLTARVGDAFSAPVLYGVAGRTEGPLDRQQLLALAEIAQAHGCKLRLFPARSGEMVVEFAAIAPTAHRRAEGGG